MLGDEIYLNSVAGLNQGFFLANLNSTNIFLFPKIDVPIIMRDLRPILCNVLYKIISKVLANRLRKVLSKCTSQEQSSFVEGRSILDNVLYS